MFWVSGIFFFRCPEFFGCPEVGKLGVEARQSKLGVGARQRW